MVWIFYLAGALGLFILRVRDPDTLRPYTFRRRRKRASATRPANAKMALLSELEVPPFALYEQPEDPAEVVLPRLPAAPPVAPPLLGTPPPPIAPPLPAAPPEPVAPSEPLLPPEPLSAPASVAGTCDSR